MILIFYLALYLCGLIIAEVLYRYNKFNEDHNVVLWSWIGVFVILLSMSGKS